MGVEPIPPVYEAGDLTICPICDQGRSFPAAIQLSVVIFFTRISLKFSFLAPSETLRAFRW